MNAHVAVQAGKEGTLFTVVSIFGTLFPGFFVGKWLGLGRHVVHLISCGTAICGGSAIGPVLQAKDEEMSVGLGTGFVLNTFAPAAKPLGPILVGLAKIGLTVTLFFIGAGLSARVVRSVGIKPYVLGIVLWLVISTAALYVIMPAV